MVILGCGVLFSEGVYGIANVALYVMHDALNAFEVLIFKVDGVGAKTLNMVL